MILLIEKSGNAKSELCYRGTEISLFHGAPSGSNTEPHIGFISTTSSKTEIKLSFKMQGKTVTSKMLRAHNSVSASFRHFISHRKTSALGATSLSMLVTRRPVQTSLEENTKNRDNQNVLCFYKKKKHLKLTCNVKKGK